MAGLIELIRYGQEELEQNKLEEAEATFSKALEKCSTVDDRQQVLGCLINLAAKYVSLNKSKQPKLLFDYLEKSEFNERITLMEALARVHQQSRDLVGAEKIYLEVFELRARNLGPAHPEAINALKTAALFRQMQGQSPEDIYARATALAKEIGIQGIAGVSKQGTAGSIAPSKSDTVPLVQASSPGTSTNAETSPSSQSSPATPTVGGTGKTTGPIPRENPHIADTPATAKDAASKFKDASESTANTNSAQADPSESKDKPDAQAETQDLQAQTAEARKKNASKRSTLYLLDELLISQAKDEILSLNQQHIDELPDQSTNEIPDFAESTLTLKASLQELLAEWESYCNMITKQLVKLLQQSSNPAYRQTLATLTTILSEGTAKQVDLDHPFIASKRKPSNNYLDWSILKELAPVYSAYDGTWGTYPFEIGMIYASLRRAFELGPLHVDTLQSLYRLAHLYTHEMFGCYDLDFAASTFRVCIMAFREHPEIDELSKVRSRTSLASVLLAKNEVAEAKATLKEAIKIADTLDTKLSRQELLSILKVLADCTSKLGDFETTIGVYERMRALQESVSRDAEMFETLIQLIHNYGKTGNMQQVQAYLLRIQGELDWFDDPNPMREVIALKAEELNENYLAEKMLNDIMANCKPYDAIAGRVASILIRLYERTGRSELAARLKGGK